MSHQSSSSKKLKHRPVISARVLPKSVLSNYRSLEEELLNEFLEKHVALREEFFRRTMDLQQRCLSEANLTSSERGRKCQSSSLKKKDSISPTDSESLDEGHREESLDGFYSDSIFESEDSINESSERKSTQNSDSVKQKSTLAFRSRKSRSAPKHLERNKQFGEKIRVNPTNLSDTHLKNSNNPQLLMWLRKKNYEQRMKRKTEKRIHSVQLTNLENVIDAQIARRQEASFAYDQWVHKKRKIRSSERPQKQNANDGELLEKNQQSFKDWIIKKNKELRKDEKKRLESLKHSKCNDEEKRKINEEAFARWKEQKSKMLKQEREKKTRENSKSRVYQEEYVGNITKQEHIRLKFQEELKNRQEQKKLSESIANENVLERLIREADTEDDYTYKKLVSEPSPANISKHADVAEKENKSKLSYQDWVKEKNRQKKFSYLNLTPNVSASEDSLKKTFLKSKRPQRAVTMSDVWSVIGKSSPNDDISVEDKPVEHSES